MRCQTSQEFAKVKFSTDDLSLHMEVMEKLHKYKKIEQFAVLQQWTYRYGIWSKPKIRIDHFQKILEANNLSDPRIRHPKIRE